MARCRCAEESACTCVITPGPGITVSGSGAPSSPWIISSFTNAAGTLQVVDTPSVDMELAGSGILADPHVITAKAIVGALIDFVNNPAGVDFLVTGAGSEADPLQVQGVVSRVDLATAPTNGYVLAWNGTQYVPAPPVTAPVGAIVAGPGLTGDGSSTTPLRVDLCTYAELKAACATP